MLAVILVLAAATGLAASAPSRDTAPDAPGGMSSARGTSDVHRTPRRHADSGGGPADASREPAGGESKRSHDSGCLVSGRVVGADGAPVEKAEVSVFGAFGRIADKQVGADSTFEFEIETSGAVRCVARVRGLLAVGSAWATAARGGSIDAGTLVLRPGARIAGRVCDPPGAAVRGAYVECAAADDDALEAWRGVACQEWAKNTRCGDDGGFELTGLPPGRYRLRISPPGACPWWSGGCVVAAGEEHVVLTMPAEYVPRGCGCDVRAQDADGNAISEFHASLRAWGAADEADANEGLASVGLIETPPFRLTVGARGFQDVTIEDVQGLAYTAVVRLAKSSGAEARLDVSGAAEFEGAPLPKGASVDLQLRAAGDDGARGDPLDRVTVGAGGRFVLHPRAGGDWRIAAEGTVRRDGGEIAVMGRVEVASGDDGVRILLLPKASIAGRVRLADGAVADELWVSLVERRPAGVVLTASIGPERRTFEVCGLPSDGVFLVGVSVRVGDEWMRGTVVDGVVPGGPPIDVAFESGLAIDGTVVRADGSPVAGAIVFTQADHPHYRSAATGVDGKFRLTGLRVGTESLRAQAPGLVLAGPAEPVSAGETGVRLVVVPATR